MPLKIISVTGAHSSVGKTSLCALLLGALENYGAIKCTGTDMYTSVTDAPDILAEKGKDTDIMRRSGAEKVVWVQSGGDDLDNALHLALGRMDGLRGVIVEGNSPASVLNPQLTLFVFDEEGEIKESARPVLEKADMVVINARSHSSRPFPALPGGDRNIPSFVINLQKKEGDIKAFLESVRRYLEG